MPFFLRIACRASGTQGLLLLRCAQQAQRSALPKSKAMTMLYMVLALYGLASALYLVYFVAARDGIARAAKLALLGAFLAHTVDIGQRGVAGVHPITSTAEAVSFTAWLVAGGYLIISLRSRLIVVGG